MSARKLIMIIIATLVIIYPFLVYFGLIYFNLRYVILLLGFIFLLRFFFISSTQRAKKSPFKMTSLLAIILGLGICVLGLIINNPLIVKLYPVLMNLLFLGVFLNSYVHPPTIVERLARITTPDLPLAAVYYTQKVTLVWCMFFCINALVSAYTVFFCSIHVWAIYNGFIAYLIIGFIFIVEYIVRIFVKKIIESKIDV